MANSGASVEQKFERMKQKEILESGDRKAELVDNTESTGKPVDK